MRKLPCSCQKTKKGREGSVNVLFWVLKWKPPLHIVCIRGLEILPFCSPLFSSLIAHPSREPDQQMYNFTFFLNIPLKVCVCVCAYARVCVYLVDGDGKLYGSGCVNHKLIDQGSSSEPSSNSVTNQDCKTKGAPPLNSPPLHESINRWS